MPYPPHVKAIAYEIDPTCWRSYSGKPVEIKRALDVRRTAALRQAEDLAIFKERWQLNYAGAVTGRWSARQPQPKRDPMSNPDAFISSLLAALARDGWHEVSKSPEPKRYHSPVMKIAMVLHFAVIAGPFTPEAQRTSPAYTKFVKQLLADGLIERPTHEEREEHPGWAYRATEKGLAYVEGLKDVQLPVELETTTTWGIPT